MNLKVSGVWVSVQDGRGDRLGFIQRIDGGLKPERNARVKLKGR
ncbi:hypothetical protein [Mechercharimyces sp. CAU 1602]|nr:hypothetical protein [Mechercharimyces sp. CAU 1602]MCS1351170.1 hypothetical protein [Mechercharimyces sp. CAU 1602]